MIKSYVKYTHFVLENTSFFILKIINLLTEKFYIRVSVTHCSQAWRQVTRSPLYTYIYIYIYIYIQKGCGTLLSSSSNVTGTIEKN